MGFQSFGDRDVVESGITVPGLGGLQKALAVDELEKEVGDRFVLAVDFEVAKVIFEALDKDEPDGDLRRVHALRALNGTLIPRSLVANELAEQARRVEEAKGIDELPFAEGDDTDPELCPHDRPVGECSVCPAQPSVTAAAESDVEADFVDAPANLRAVPG